MLKKLLAWLVHLYTASGGVFALLSLRAIDQEYWAEAMAWLIACFAVDGSDGVLARRAKVAEVLPSISGKDIDYVIDFLTYAFVPAYFIYRSGLVPPEIELAMAVYVILVSAIYYGKKGMVSGKNQFAGFPVLWNLVVFYCFFVFYAGPWVNVVLILFFGILHFIPVEISYPSKNLKTSPWPFIVGFAMLAVLSLILFYYPATNSLLLLMAWLGFAYFVGLSVKYTWLI